VLALCWVPPVFSVSPVMFYIKLPSLRYRLAVFCCEDVHVFLFVTEPGIYISSYCVEAIGWQI
jgi:hypothetical protein